MFINLPEVFNNYLCLSQKLGLNMFDNFFFMLILFKNKFVTKRIQFTSKIQIEKRKKQYESNISNYKI